PRSSLDYLRVLNEKIKELKLGQIGTLMGRYYSMDRSENWELTSLAYNTLVKAKGHQAASAEVAIQRAYDNDTTPDGTEMFDEYIPPTVIGDYPGIKDGDSVIYFNYRQDRAIQLTRAFIEEDYPGQRGTKLDIVFCGLTRYYDEFKFNILDALDESKDMENLLGQVIADKGLKQLRIAETQKFRHVTSFFNGKIIEPFKNEERIKIESVYDPATFAEHPEMNAYEVKDEVIKQIKTNKFDFVAVNFANCDMVGHTGDMEAAKKAVEVVDECVGQVVEAASDIGAVVLITADHGNAEEMVDHKTGLTKTAHSTNPVEFIYISADTDGIKLRPKGILADIAPTVLYLMDIEKPIEMTAENLIVE
ncbi:MAG: 2,3-bisphosphoglycerate-independent phosphoglycerate mutase, partial [Candidatus Omnitrophica bacterium]|nr:2,3-bisphosphoglycerate-independent phosphoglycerate mutase [Candidatus Omnitrophota bacterium]